MKQEIEVIESWEQLTVAQFEELCEIQAAHPKNSAKYIVEYLYGIPNADNIPLAEYSAYVAGLNKFVGEPVLKAKLTPNAAYTLNGREYRVDITPSAFTVAQYTDLTNHIKNQASLIDILSVVVVPDGKEYNDGYDMQQAKDDIGTMQLTAAFAVVGFFARWSKSSIDTFLRSLTKTILKGKTGKIAPELAAKLKAEVETLLSLTASLLTSSPTAASPSRR